MFKLIIINIIITLITSCVIYANIHKERIINYKTHISDSVCHEHLIGD